MPIRAARSVSVLLLSAAMTAAVPAMAQKVVVERGGVRAQRMQPPRVRGEEPHEGRALAAAVRRVERRTGGQVLSAERVPYEGRSLNRIKVVDATGRVRIYMDDPTAAPGPRERARADEPQRTRGDDS